jgi:DNA-binding ferritin-like protein
MSNKLKFSSLYGGANSMVDGQVNRLDDIISEHVSKLLQLRTDIKMFHWKTKSFAYHKVSDELLESIDDLTDKLIEAVSGVTNSKPQVNLGTSISINNLSSKDDFIKKLIQASDFLRRPSELVTYTEIANIRDEILGSIDKALYLLSFD